MPHPSVAPRKIWPRADEYFNKYAAILESQKWGVSNEKDDEKIIRLKTILKLVSESLDWMNSDDEEDAYIDEVSDNEDSDASQFQRFHGDVHQTFCIFISESSRLFRESTLKGKGRDVRGSREIVSDVGRQLVSSVLYSVFP